MKSNTSTEWLISGNPKKYDVIHAFRELQRVDWRQSCNVQVGDIIYIYVSDNIQCIKFKCRANKVDIKIPDIDDSKYNRSGEFDGSAGRYMELEMLEEYDTSLYARTVLERYGFFAPQSPIRVTQELKEYLDVVQSILTEEDLKPEEHDGSYELVAETIRAYAKMEDNTLIDYKDLNLVYLMTVGTWKQKVSAKKETVEKSHLPEIEKERLKQLLDAVWKRAENREYSNSEGEKTSLGMFGTGFFSFENKTDETSPREFIRMCVDIQTMEEEEDIYRRCEETLTANFKGMRAASASMILHCLKPYVFPVFNANMGSKNIFEYFGVKLKSKNDLHTYIQNVRQVKEFRDRNFRTKNYRVFDMAAWKTNQDDVSDEDVLTDNSSLLSKINHMMQGDADEMLKSKFAKNTILYGPPGTGKTYSSAIYAVAICDQIPLEKVKTMGYDVVMDRYRKLVEENRIAFTTFHQSYGYEEFIEGIKPIVDEDEKGIGYRVEPGVFKKFCERSQVPAGMKVKSNATIWFMRLDSYGRNNKAECFNRNKAIAGGGTDRDWFEKRFVDMMQVGDYIISYAGNSVYIDAIGLVTGEVEKISENDTYYWSRDVEWSVFANRVDVWEMNGNRYLPNFEIARMNHMKVSSLLQLVPSCLEMPHEKPCVFIIDEINRGNISKIFGELITLIEDTKRGGMTEEASAILPYSGESFSVPSNVYILGTMNTADRSIALMDTALRRRFQFIEMMPDADVLRSVGADHVDGLDVAAMLEKINERIAFLYDREHTIGHAFFTKLAKASTVEMLAEIFEKSVIPLLQEYFYEDYQKIQLVLGDNGKIDEHKFILDQEVKVRDLFRGNVEDVVDLPEKKYTINREAFFNIESYKGIL